MSAPRFVQSARRLDAEREGDLRRGEFLRALDESDYTVTDWEAQFIESFLNFTSTRPGDAARWWTPGRRTSCDRMMSHYAALANR